MGKKRIVSEPVEENCLECKKKLDDDLHDNYMEVDEGLICDDCYYEDSGNPYITVIDETGTKYYKSHYQEFDEYCDYIEPDNRISKYFNTIKYIQTDGWRGYYKGDCPPGYTQLKKTWFCGFDGYNMDDFMVRLHDIMEEKNNELLNGFDFFVSLLQTSNVFSTCFEVYVKDSQVDSFQEYVMESDIILTRS